MRSFALMALSGLTTLAIAGSDHMQASAGCAPSQSNAGTGVYADPDGRVAVPTNVKANGYGGSDNRITVTVTSTATVTATVVNTVNAGQTGGHGGYGGSGSTTQPPSSKQTHHVDVGAFKIPNSNKTELLFKPNNITANTGDVVLFNMLGAAHSVTESKFFTPCTKSGPFDTELQPNPKNESGLIIEKYDVLDTKPHWFYCKQQNPKPHCQQGMVFGINPQDKMAQFIALAKEAPINNATATATATATAIATATAAPSSSVTAVTVSVGANKELKFTPPFLSKVAIGSTIHFDFRAKNHTLTESSLTTPCNKLVGTDVDTNFQNFNPDDKDGLPGFDLKVTSNSPRFFYCKQRQGNHCGQGMVFGLNIDEPTFGTLKSNAIRINGTVAAAAPKIKGRAAIRL